MNKYANLKIKLMKSKKMNLNLLSKRMKIIYRNNSKY